MLDLDSRRLWKPGVPELSARLEFSISSVRFKGYLKLDSYLEGNLDSLNLDKLDSRLYNHLLDSSDFSTTDSFNTLKGKGRHASNEVFALDTCLDDDVIVDVLDVKFFSKKSYGGFKYNDISHNEFEEGEEDGICDNPLSDELLEDHLYDKFLEEMWNDLVEDYGLEFLDDLDNCFIIWEEFNKWKRKDKHLSFSSLGDLTSFKLKLLIKRESRR